jgi:hypothetical protein
MTPDDTPPLQRVADLNAQIAAEVASDDPSLGAIDFYLQAAREELAAAAEGRIDG